MTQAQAHQHFALRGLQLGMTSQQVRRVFYAQHKVITKIVKDRCVSDFLQQKRKHLSDSKAPTHCVSKIDAPDKYGALNLSFVEDFPTRPGIVVLSTISIDPDPHKSRQISDLRIFAHNIFGKPSFINTNKNPDPDNWLSEAWCTESCRSLNQMLVTGDFRYRSVAALGKDGKLLISDGEYYSMRYENMTRYLAARGIMIDQCAGTC
jgi:hypothetical protein